MADNRQGNIPQTSGPSRRAFLQPWTIGAIVIAGVLVGGAAVLYATTRTIHFGAAPRASCCSSQWSCSQARS